MKPSLGVVFRPQSPPEDLHAVVTAAEDAGIDQLWLWEDCFLEGGLTTAGPAPAGAACPRRPPPCRGRSASTSASACCRCRCGTRLWLPWRSPHLPACGPT